LYASSFARLAAFLGFPSGIYVLLAFARNASSAACASASTAAATSPPPAHDAAAAAACARTSVSTAASPRRDASRAGRCRASNAGSAASSAFARFAAGGAPASAGAGAADAARVARPLKFNDASRADALGGVEFARQCQMIVRHRVRLDACLTRMPPCRQRIPRRTHARAVA
jgi:hypothetical protein